MRTALRENTRLPDQLESTSGPAGQGQIYLVPERGRDGDDRSGRSQSAKHHDGDADYPLSLKLATSRAEFRSAFQLLYRTYLARHYITPRAREIVYRLSYGLPSSRTLIARRHGPKGGSLQSVGTLTVIGDGCLGLPMESIYHAEVQSLRDAGLRLAEVSGLAIDIPQRSPSLAAFFVLTQFLVQYSCWKGIDDLLISIHPRHVPFYRHWFHFLPFGPCRAYQAVGGHPAVACRLDLKRLQETQDPLVYRRYFSTIIPTSRFDVPPIRPADHSYFCAQAGLLPTYASEALMSRPALATDHPIPLRRPA